MLEAAQHFVDLGELMQAADRAIAAATGAEAGFITSCAGGRHHNCDGGLYYPR